MRAQSTLLSKLGFQDTDKQLPDHDLACLYLTEKDVITKIQHYFTPPQTKKNIQWKRLLQNKELQRACKIDVYSKDELDILAQQIQKQINIIKIENHWKTTEIQKEKPISKGKEQYKTTIGFLDVFLRYTHKYIVHWQLKSNPEIGGTITKTILSSIIFEVKTHLHVSDFLRQIKLYKEYQSNSIGVLVVTKPISSEQYMPIYRENIQIIHLDEDFQLWKKKQNKHLVNVPKF